MASSPASDPTPNTPISFSSVIDNDHTAINSYAGRLKRSQTPTERAHLLREVTWRLVRHDVSEDLVMRPAFIKHLGDLGREMAEHDRTDHERAKIELLGLFERMATPPSLPSPRTLPPLTSPSTSTSTSTSSSAVAGADKDFHTTIDALFAELLDHMKTESGEQIPMLERALDPAESQRLGREYLKTQVLTPDLEIVDPEDGDGVTRRVWCDVEAYARTDLATFRDVYAQVTDEQAMSAVGMYYRHYVHGKL